MVTAENAPLPCESYTFDDFYEDEDIVEICKENGVDKACVIRTWKSNRAENWVTRENSQYESHQLPVYTSPVIRAMISPFLSFCNSFLRFSMCYINFNGNPFDRVVSVGEFRPLGIVKGAVSIYDSAPFPMFTLHILIP